MAEVNKIIFIDLDQVLLDLITPWIAWVNLNALTNYELIDMVAYDTIPQEVGMWTMAYWHLMDYCEDVEPFDGAVEFLEKLGELGYEVNIITTSPPNMIDRKNEMCMDYFFGLYDNIIHVPKSSMKVQYLDNHIFIDDYCETIKERKRKQEPEDFDPKKNILFSFNKECPYSDVESKLWENASSYDDILRLIGEGDK